VPHTWGVAEHEGLVTRSQVTSRPVQRAVVSNAGVSQERQAEATADGFSHRFSFARIPVTREQAERGRPRDLPTGTDVWATVAPTIEDEGQPLDTQARATIEAHLGHDFSTVRVHADARADASARTLHAAAYTVGDHIAFAAGEYRPGTHAGRILLAHELTHVMQRADRRRPDTPMQVYRSGPLGLFGDLFTSPIESLSRLFGEGTFSTEDLTGYLKKLRESGQPEGDYDSDNKARALVARWVAGERDFQLNPRLKAILVREMYKGTTSEGDAKAIMDIVERSLEPDVMAIFGAGGVSPKDLYDAFNAPEQNRLIAFLNQHVKGGYVEAFAGHLVPLGGVSAAPHLNDETFRARWEAALLVGIAQLETAKVAGGCAFPGPGQLKSDTDNWELQQTNRDLFQGQSRFVPKSASPYEAVGLLFANLGKWSCECLFYTQLAQLFAWRSTLTPEAFNAKFANFTTGAGRGAPTTGLDFEQGDEDDPASLKAAPVGTIAVWFNRSPAAKGTAFEFEHAIKVFHGDANQPEMYAAHPFGPGLTEDAIRLDLAGSSADFPFHFQLTASVLPQLASDGVSPSLINNLKTILGVDKVTWLVYRQLPPLHELIQMGNPEALEQLEMIRKRAKGSADPAAAAAYVKDNITLHMIEIPK
jgi:hypothetical protein